MCIWAVQSLATTECIKGRQGPVGTVRRHTTFQTRTFRNCTQRNIFTWHSPMLNSPCKDLKFDLTVSLNKQQALWKRCLRDISRKQSPRSACIFLICPHHPAPPPPTPIRAFLVYNRLYHQTAKALMILCGRLGWYESAHLVYMIKDILSLHAFHVKQ